MTINLLLTIRKSLKYYLIIATWRVSGKWRSGTTDDISLLTLVFYSKEKYKLVGRVNMEMNEVQTETKVEQRIALLDCPEENMRSF